MNPAPNRQAGVDRLHAFLPCAGERYARLRNTDFGPDRRRIEDGVSGLSPWLAHRLLTEREVVEAATSVAGSEKFVQEVLWRSYWQGWSTLRPSVWFDFCAAVPTLRDRHASDVHYHRALAGGTGIVCFDAWRAELRDTGYLHNHARMWFSSIWIYTLRLPWQLGAALFLRELLDGDAASNTLSWRWVAGLHTEGKRYLARADNIQTFTDGRFHPGQQLADAVPDSLSAFAPHPDPVIPRYSALSRAAKTLALVTSEDCGVERLCSAIEDTGGVVLATVGVWHSQRLPNEPASDQVSLFSQASVESALAESKQKTRLFDASAPRSSARLIEYTQQQGCDTIAVSHTAPGWSTDYMASLETACDAVGIRLVRVQDAWDAALWPLASGGFFGFYKKALKQLPALLP